MHRHVCLHAACVCVSVCCVCVSACCMCVCMLHVCVCMLHVCVLPLPILSSRAFWSLEQGDVIEERLRDSHEVQPLAMTCHLDFF